MSTSAKAGMGVGITFGILSVASISGFYLYRRRRNQRYGRDNTGGLGGFFILNRKTAKSDDEWQIRSAEKVEIVRGASAKSVRTGSRSDSRGSGDGGKRVGLEVLKVGMRVPDRRPNPALTSNPPSTSSSNMSKEEKTTSWPLPD
ncbi:hypothetical protein K469DRAFT_701764 [Zopfia rhizophila CBS 207.26]|uniref:Uncharacterized protein n=1 Tax=Zopfia rhizophila CBS 207.26 TaxID=1314779 RepID=A0A6A6EDQ5_9PEZI|nr:hypothetical protein K469DRAFT_701764 [Zopfia rhizophila CBS 207.26]